MASSKALAYSVGSVAPLAAQFDSVFESAFLELSEPAFTIRFWDDSKWNSSSESKSSFCLWLRNSQALNLLLKHPDDVSFGNCFLRGDLYIEGDFAKAIYAWPALKSCLRRRLTVDLVSLRETISELTDSLSRYVHLGPKHSKERDKAAAAEVFNQPPEFFQTFLGDSLLYASGNFTGESSSLEDAQQRRLTKLCEKLMLPSGGRFLDVGCGWGTAALFTAAKCEAHVRGITWSREQAHHGRDRASGAQLASLCRIDQRDFRDLEVIHLPFDRAWSLGITEHVGRKNLHRFFTSVHDTLVSGGLFLLETITRPKESHSETTMLTSHFLFPDREVLRREEIENAARKAGFEVCDTDDVTKDYRLTLQHWLEALVANEQKATHFAEKAVVRKWKLALADAMAEVARANVGAYQILLRKGANRIKAVPRDEEWVIG
jgi:cyclopropane-fatty-acyl-phospholipid synthase